MRPVRRKTAARAAVFTCATLVACASLAVSRDAAAAPSARQRLHSFAALALAPDGARVAAIESDEAAVDGAPVRQHLIVRDVAGGTAHEIALPCDPSPDCVPGSPTWSPDGARLVFTVRVPKSKHRFLYAATPDGLVPKRLLDFVGTLGTPRFARDGALALLATPGARKEVGATQAGAPIVGEIGADEDEQRIAVLEPSGTLRYASPPDLYVYEYDWTPDGRGFVGTAARGNGDDNWWIAKLYAFDRDRATARVLYAPGDPKLQIASPRVSPDGSTVAFIGGIMSDFGSTGGDLFVVPANGGSATNVTPAAKRSVRAIAWSCAHDATAASTLDATALAGSETTVDAYRIGGTAPPTTLWRAPQSIAAGDGAFAQACRAGTTAVVRQDFEHPPEIALGALGDWHELTHANAGLAPAVRATSVTWTSDAFDVQGWLLAPRDLDPAKKYPLVVDVHGGPAAASVPRFVGAGTTRDYVRDGYFVFLPNPRGSFGGGETFARANVRDFGYGDLRDILAGVDAVERREPIDDARLGITGGSYGGFMTMWAVTQTQRFKAAVAGAGLSNWESYYGENGIDEWMIPYFGASAYDDPAVYRKSSPIAFVTHVKTPTFAYVGERDVETPAPQSLEFWHALHALGVPTQLVIYPGEGHGIRNPAARADVAKRSRAWFARYLK